jgi:Molybdopterin-guanine dinucleotide biosynthesis protein A
MDRGQISGFILAGGKSSRMGTDKAMLSFRGKPLLKHICDLIEPFCCEIIICGSKMEYESFGLKMLPDLYTNIGPISGIYSALNYSRTEWTLIVSVDTPMINRELLEFLISNKESFDSVVPSHNAGFEPLIALYNRSALSSVKEMIDTENYRIADLLSRININELDCNDLVDKFPKLFLNLNRMDDYLSL